MSAISQVLPRLPLGPDEVNSVSFLKASIELWKTRRGVHSPSPLGPQAVLLLFGIYAYVAYKLGLHHATVKQPSTE